MTSNSNTDIDKLITFGQMALEQGWYDKTQEYFEQALALDASNREAMKGLARANEILTRRAAMTVEPTQAEPVEPSQKQPRGSPMQWFKSQSRLGKIAILASMTLPLCCLCASLVILLSVWSFPVRLWNPFTPSTQPTVEIIPTVTPALPTLAPFPTTTVPTQQPTSAPVPTRTSPPTATPTTQMPIIRIGDTIPEFSAANPNLSLTLLSWKESDIAIDGPYVSGYYAFTAKPGMKFVILTFRF